MTLPLGYNMGDKLIRVIKEVRVSCDELVEMNLEEFLDVISARAGYPLLEDIDWRPVKMARDRRIILKVRGYAMVEEK